MAAPDNQASFFRAEAEHQLEVVDRPHTVIRTRHKLLLQARRKSRFYVRTYTFTGSGIEKDPLILSGRDELGHATHRLHGPVLRDRDERLFLIDLGREYAAGEQVEVEFKQTFLNLDRTMSQFLGHTAEQDCRRLNFRVLIPAEFRGSAVMLKAHHSHMSQAEVRVPLEPEDFMGKYGETHLFSHEEHRPVAGYNYRIEWKV